MIDKAVAVVLEQVKKQGFTVILLCVAVYFLVIYIQDLNGKIQAKEKEQDARIADCHNEMEQYLAEDRVMMIRALDNNTQALEDVTMLIKKHEE